MSTFGPAKNGAEAQLTQAKASEGEFLAARALGEDVGTSPVDAEAELERKQNDLAVARRTRDALQDRLQRETAEVERTKREADYAVRDLVKAEAPIADMLARAQELQKQLVSARAEIRELHRFHCVADEHAKAVESFVLAVSHQEFVDLDNHASAWRDAIERLRADAEAKLPI